MNIGFRRGSVTSVVEDFGLRITWYPRNGMKYDVSFYNI